MSELKESSADRPVLLVVEDDNALRESLCDLLRLNYDFLLLSARTGSEALELIAGNSLIDLLITDFDLSGSYDGLDVARAIREKFPNASIVLMTSKQGGDRRVSEFLSIPNTLFLEKPFKFDSLERAIGIATFKTKVAKPPRLES